MLLSEERKLMTNIRSKNYEGMEVIKKIIQRRQKEKSEEQRHEAEEQRRPKD